jgi:hypothetical protein
MRRLQWAAEWDAANETGVLAINSQDGNRGWKENTRSAEWWFGTGNSAFELLLHKGSVLPFPQALLINDADGGTWQLSVNGAVIQSYALMSKVSRIKEVHLRGLIQAEVLRVAAGGYAPQP